MSLPNLMKAAIIQSQGDLKVIQVNSIPVPSPGQNQLLIKVDYAGVNFIDTYQRAGLYKLPMPFILGNECAGTVVSVGEGVDFSVGDQVAAYVAGGAFAEYAICSNAKTVKLDGLSTRDAATILLQGLTALTFVREAHAVKAGEFIAVQAAAGGLGLLLTQLCTALGAHVIGTTSTPEKALLAKAAGAKDVLLYDGSINVPEAIYKITGGEGIDRGVHAVFDGVGKDTFEMDLEILRRKGTLVSCGNASGAVPPVAVLRLGPKNLKLCRPVLGQYVYVKQEFTDYAVELFQLVKDGKLKLSTWNEYELTTEGIKQSQIDITSRKTSGKLLIKIA